MGNEGIGDPSGVIGGCPPPLTEKLTSPSVSERNPSPVASTTALGVSALVALAHTPTVGSKESTSPIASYPTLGPRSLLPK